MQRDPKKSKSLGSMVKSVCPFRTFRTSCVIREHNASILYNCILYRTVLLVVICSILLPLVQHLAFMPYLERFAVINVDNEDTIPENYNNQKVLLSEEFIDNYLNLSFLYVVSKIFHYTYLSLWCL